MHISCTDRVCRCGGKRVSKGVGIGAAWTGFLGGPVQLNDCKKLSMRVLKAASFFRVSSIFLME